MVKNWYLTGIFFTIDFSVRYYIFPWASIDFPRHIFFPHNRYLLSVIDSYHGYIPTRLVAIIIFRLTIMLYTYITY